MTDMKEIYDKDPEFRRIWHEIQDMKERMLWVGCGTEKQAIEGFKLIAKCGPLYKQLSKVMEKY